MRQNAPGARLSRGQLTLCWVRIPQRLPGCSVHSPGQHAPCAASQARACPPGERACQPTAEASGQAAAERAAQRSQHDTNQRQNIQLRGHQTAAPPCPGGRADRRLRVRDEGLRLVSGRVCAGPIAYLYIAAGRTDARSCRRQGLPGLPWCAGIPVRRACRTGTVPLAVELIEVTAQGVNGSPAGIPGCRRARGLGSGMAGLPAGCLRTAGDPGPEAGASPGSSSSRGSGRRPGARQCRGGAGRCGPGSPGYRRVRLPGASRPFVPSR
jgi:hypothetical protein